MRQHMTNRRGFTLLELLVVLAIIGILVTLVASAVFRLRSSRDEVVTNETLQKIEGGYALQRKAAMDIIRKEQPFSSAQMLANYYGVDELLAKAIHTKLRMRQEFPDALTELNANTLFPNVNTGDTTFNNYVNNTVIPLLKTQYAPKATYTQHTTTLSAAGAPEQNAVLLALVLTVSRGSASFDPETAIGGAGTATLPSGSLKYFKDRWGRPIQFRRQAPSSDPYMNAVLVPELNEKPYTDTGKPRGLNHSWDAMDPDNRIGRINNVKACLDTWLGQVNTGDNRMTLIFSDGQRLGVNGDELYGFRLKGTGKGS